MRIRLFLLCLTLCLCSSAFALDSGNYLVRNVATGRYWGAANRWGTQASLVSNPEYITWTKLDDGRYHLESQVNNGGEAYYFNGDFMDNDSPVALTIEQQANGYYTISNGEIYYGYNGSNTVMGKTETDPAAPNVQWEIISVADATAALSGATQAAPMNATFLVADPNFGRNNRHYGEWTFEASNKNNEGDVTNYCVESWHATFTMSQTINVPNGVYSLSAQGFYRQDGTDNDHLPVFFLNDATRTFPIRTGTENSMALTSASFSEGRYAIDPIYVTVTDGTITLGARLEGNTMLWCIWDNFTLMYYGTDANQKQMEFGTRFGGKANKVEQLLATPGITIEGLQRLNDAKTALAQIDYNASESSQQTVEQQIDAAIAYAEEGLQLAEQLNTYYNKYGDKVGSAATDNQELTATLTNISVALMQQTFESNNQIEQWMEALTTARSQYYPYEYRYWFDNDESTVQTDVSSLPTWSFDADVSQLTELMHTLHFQVFGKDGVPSTPLTRFFVKGFDRNATTGFCWFDNDETTKTAIADLSQPIELDVSQLVDGFHILHIQANGTDGTVSTPVTRAFIKTPQVKGVDYLTCLCIVDDQLYKQEQVSANGGVLEWQLDVSQLSQGFHRMFVQVVTPSGAATSAYQSFFMRETTAPEYAQMKCVYAIDGAEFFVEAGEVAKGTFHFDLDVSALDDGLHRITYMLSNGQGVSTKAQTQFFVKTPLGGNGITAYWYWLNDQADSNATKVQLAERQDPFSLISLLPVESQPLRSSLFEFRIEDEQPVLYAKNDFHVRFYDASGRFTDATKQFVDESVRQEVEPVGELQTTQTFPRVAEGDIRWYTMQVAPGDTTAFRLSQAATLQVFAPSGKEVFNTSESASVNWNGIHTWEEGTYYLAVHDVTGSRSNITLDYFHMDKYDVVNQDVDLVGNGGCSTITVDGNGFRDLYSVDLFTAQGDSIHHVDIGHESDAQTSVTFDFSDAALGEYDAVFHFTTEDKVFHKFVTVEEAKGIELATTVTYPSTFLRGSSTTYTVKITNKGNMTAYAVPIYAYLMNKNKEDGISRIIIEGLSLRSLLDAIDVDSISIAERLEIEELIEEIGDGHYFQQFRVKDEISLGDSIWVKCGYFFTNIAPRETKTMRLVITASEEVIAYVSVPEDWSVFSKTEENVLSRSLVPSKRSTLKDAFCCYHEKIECFLNIGSLVSDIVEGASIALAPFTEGASMEVAVKAKWIGCALSSLGTLSSWSSTMFCDADKSFGEKLKEQGFMNTVSVFATILSCAPKEIKSAKTIAKLFKAVKYGKSIPGALSCRSNPQRVPNCPPIPPGGGSSTPQPPSDPNDIYGYLAESGSKFIADSVAKVNYTIEFENDTTFAMASAHTIVVRDTLDNRYFDLNSFQPISVKLGEHNLFLNEGDVTTKNGVTSFIKTIDVRPAINAIAQVEGSYNQQTGIAEWRFTSLDPMTMEPTDDLMQGILPVNYNGTSGIGEVMYEIGVKPNKSDGTEISNRAGIVFDYEETILTPTWTNIVDGTAPESHITDVQMLNDSTASVRIEASDELSGPWRYNVYVQYGSGAWFLGAENVPADTTASVKVYEGINHGFYVVAADSAGNVEQKNAEREYTFEVFGSQVDTETKLELAQGWNWMSHNQQEPLPVTALQPAGARMVGQTEELYKDTRFGWMGDLEELLPTQMYKLQLDEPMEVQLSGRLFNASFRSIPLYQGWNWMGYPVANTMTPAEALAKLEAEEGDMLIGQDGMSTYSDGQWQGTLLTMVPGQGYMFFSQSDKNLFFNASAQASSRRAYIERNRVNSAERPDGWSVDKHKYPNVMGVIAQLWNGQMQEDVAEWVLAAFCGNECRGIGQPVGEVMMMNVYGSGGEQIGFRVMNIETGEVLGVSNQEAFHPEVLGTMAQPYQLTMGEPTGIKSVSKASSPTAIYDLMGRRLQPSTPLDKGIYVVIDSENKTIQKVIRK